MVAELPSLKGLQAFEAAARYRSVTLASNELNVTPGAVSLQIRELEARLGVQLFFRKPRSIQLTREGERYYGALRTAFRTSSRPPASAGREGAAVPSQRAVRAVCPDQRQLQLERRSAHRAEALVRDHDQLRSVLRPIS